MSYNVLVFPISSHEVFVEQATNANFSDQEEDQEIEFN